jgi:hypothetical protein
MVHSLVDIYRYRRGTKTSTLRMEAAGSSDKSVTVYQTKIVTFQKTVIFIVTALGTSNLAQIILYDI